MLSRDVRDNLVVIVRIVGPMDVNAIAFCSLLELFEVFRKMRKDVLFGFGSEIPKLFPLRDGYRRTVPGNTHRPDQSIKMALVLAVLDEQFSVFCLVDSSHFRPRLILGAM